MSKEPVAIQTQVPMQQVGELFRRSMRVSWVSENITGAGTQFERPPADAFDDLNTDPPHFTVMAILGGRGAQIQKSAVHMAAWDRGSHREIQLAVGKNLGALGFKAKGKMRKFVEALSVVDPQTRYSPF